MSEPVTEYKRRTINSMVVYQMDETDLTEAINNTLGELTRKTVLNTFSGDIVPMQVAEHILKVSNRTILRYIGAGIITPVDHSKGEHLKFDLKELLEFRLKKCNK